MVHGDYNILLHTSHSGSSILTFLLVTLLCSHHILLPFFFLYFFFLMIRRPPRSTLFPTRRSSDLRLPGDDRPRAGPPRRAPRAAAPLRSEEHTSELQSHVNLVCRLLLEKKKKKINRISIDMSEIQSLCTYKMT